MPELECPTRLFNRAARIARVARAARAARGAWLVAAAAGVATAGCAPRLPGGFDSLDPAERARTIVTAAERNDEAAAPELVGMLESDDPGTRLLAIEALDRLTGERFGYDYAAPEFRRREAVERWRRWLSGRAGPGGSADSAL